MSEPFLAEIRMFAGNFAPTGWALCDGQTLSISQYTALFSLLGTTYGGDGKTTFALPNLQGSVPMHIGGAQPGPGLQTYNLGESGGEDFVTLLTSEMPAHTHTANADTGAGTQASPGGGVWAEAKKGKNAVFRYAPSGTNVLMNPSAISVAGGSQPHNNLQPYLVLTFIIALQGIYPTRP